MTLFSSSDQNNASTMTTLPLATSSSTKPLYKDDDAATTASSSRSKYVIAIACLLFVFLVCVILSLTISSKSNEHPQHSPSSTPSATTKVRTTDILSACQATRNPSNCRYSLEQSILVPTNPTPLQVIQSSLLVSSQNLETAQTMLKSVLSSSSANPNLTTVANICLEVLDYSQYRISSSNDSLPRGELKNARAWMSAALSYEYDCFGGLKHYINDTQSINKTMSYLENLINCTSNALSMMVSYDLFGNETQSWRPPQTERNGFWEGSMLRNDSGFNGGIPPNLKVDVIVCKDGTNGCYKTVQEAVNAAPVNAWDSRFVVHIKEGVYDEIVRVPFDKKNVVFIGDGMNKTVITGSLKSGQRGVTTYDSATVGVLGDGFMATGLTIQNTAGTPTQQAVAFRSDSDQSVIENCEFIGNQDTLYAHSLRQYYKSCKIQGNVDFIFGNAVAIFQDCKILVSPRQEKPEEGGNNVVTAHGRTDPSQSTGFVFKNCSINGTDKYMEFYNSKPSVHRNYLGRPWKEYSRTVYLGCNLEALVTPQGWMIWNDDFALKTLYYGEFQNSGPGSNMSQRVEWSSQIPPQYVIAYSISNFIQGDEWIPSSS